MSVASVPPGLRIDIRDNLLPGRPAVILSSGYGIFGFEEPVQVRLIELLSRLNIGWAQYTYAERNDYNVTTDLLLSTGAAALSRVHDLVEAQNVSKIGLFGISFGAAISLELALVKHVPLLLLVNPVIDYVDYRTKQLGDDKVEEWLKSGYITMSYGDKEVRSYYRFMEEAKGQNLMERLPPHETQWVVCQAEDDAILGTEYAAALQTLDENAQVHIIANADHVFATDDAIRQFLTLVEPPLAQWSDER